VCVCVCYIYIRIKKKELLQNVEEKLFS
jgi:hypothetical protein